MQNYKVFINSDLIFFEQSANLKSFSDRHSDYQLIAENQIQLLVEKINNKSFRGKYLIASENPKNTFLEFLNKFEVIPAAGGIVLNTRNEILMIHRFGKWDFPKGHVEDNEVVIQAAIREVTEETGVQNLLITQKLPCTYHMYDNYGSMVIKKTHWYLMSTTYLDTLKPQMEEAILAAVWVPVYTLPEYAEKTYPSLKELMDYLLERSIISS